MNGQLLCGVISGVVVLAVALWLIFGRKTREGMSGGGLAPGAFPAAQDLLNLEPWYKPHKPAPMVSGQSRAQQYHNYPVFPARQPYPFTNNLRNWRKPNNGQCVPGDLCGKFYADLEVATDECKIDLPGFTNKRVNSYDYVIPL